MTPNVWRPASVADEPETVLSPWFVFELKNGNRHFVGRTYYSGYASEGRVSSRIVSFDPDEMVGITRSGRRYKLEGPPGFDSDANYVWHQWKYIGKILDADTKNVSEEYEKKSNRPSSGDVAG